MTRFDSRPLPGDAEFEALGPAVVLNHRIPRRRPRSWPVPDLAPSDGATGGGVRDQVRPEEPFDAMAVVNAQGRLVFVSDSAGPLSASTPSDCSTPRASVRSGSCSTIWWPGGVRRRRSK